MSCGYLGIRLDDDGLVSSDGTGSDSSGGIDGDGGVGTGSIPSSGGTSGGSSSGGVSEGGTGGLPNNSGGARPTGGSAGMRSFGGAFSFGGISGEWDQRPDHPDQVCDTNCQCSANNSCWFECQKGADACRPRCDLDSECVTYVGYVNRVVMDCGEGATCHAAGPTQDTVEFECNGKGNCRATCGATDDCSMTCSGTGDCTLYCQEASQCSMFCKEPGHCRLLGSDDLTCVKGTTELCDYGSQCNGNCQ